MSVTKVGLILVAQKRPTKEQDRSRQSKKTTYQTFNIMLKLLNELIKNMGGYARDPLKYIFLAGVSVIKGGGVV